MKVYVVIERVSENGAWDFSYGIYDTLDKAKQYLEERDKELYRSYAVEYNMKRLGCDTDKCGYDKSEKYVDYYDDWGEYHITIDVRELNSSSLHF